MTTVNEMVGKLAQRAAELADMPMPQLRRWHPDVVGQGTDYECRQATLGQTRGRIIEAILVEEFSFTYDLEIEIS